MDYYLGIDCGGTFIKAALVNNHGEITACVRKNISVISEKAGYAERDMTQLWQECADVIQQTIIKSGVNAENIQGVGISAQGKGAFLLDKQHQPLGRAILSSDQRSLEIVKRWQADEIPAKLYPITRQTLWTGHPVSILRWLKENEPERYANIGAVLMSHDYLRFCLTGELHCEETNISESNLYNMTTGQYDPALATLLGIEEIMDALPPIIGSQEIAGYITAQATRATGLKVGTPVVGGLFDVVSTALCTNLDDESKLNVVLGTWSVVSGITDHIDTQQSLHFVYGRYPQANRFIVHEASPTSAANLEWFLKQWGLSDYHAINQAVAALPPAESSVLFVPFLYGSNAGLGMQAGFYGLQSYHSQAHLIQAIYEGVVFSLIHHLNRMRQRFPHTNILRVTGGPTQSPVWMQILADISGMTLEIPQLEETGCLGAAMMAMLKSNQSSNIQTILQISHKNIVRVTPNIAVKNKYTNKYQQYLKLIQAIETLI